MLTLVEIAVAFVVVAFGAIALRFLPRDERGRRLLPRLIDESVGMYVVRGLFGRRGEPAFDAGPAEYEPTPAQIAYRIGIPGAPIPTIPTPQLVSRGSQQAQATMQAGPMPRAVPVRQVIALPTGFRRSQARPASALALQRRLAGGVAMTVVAIAVLGIALVSRGFDGGVLSATGTPAPMSSADLSGITGESAISPGPALDSPPASIAPDASSTISPPAAAPANAPPASTPAPAATSTPAQTPRSTPRPTARPATPAPTTAPTPTPQPTRPPPPRPTATPSPTLGPTPSPAPTVTPDPTPDPTPPAP